MALLKRLHFHTVCIFLLAMQGFSSCSMLETTPVSIPAYIYVPYLRDTTAVVTQGDSSNKYVDVWIYNNSKLLGNIGLPALIPIQASGMTEIEFDAGIFKSGQDEARVPYPFNQRHTFYRNLTPNKIDTFYPVMKYLPSTRFSFIEDFDRNGFEFTYNFYNSKSDSVIKVSSTSTYDSAYKSRSISLGKYCGKINMADSSQHFEMNSGWYHLEDLQPTIGAPVYLEIDYRSDLPIDIGMFVRDASGNNLQPEPEFTTNPTSTWNKVYICLDQDIAPKAPGSTFSVDLSISKGAGVHSEYIYIDNIKLVHF